MTTILEILDREFQWEGKTFRIKELRRNGEQIIATRLDNDQLYGFPTEVIVPLLKERSPS